MGQVVVHYIEHGTGRPVLVLHGAGVDHREAEACFEPLFDGVTGLRRIYPDLPGMGRRPRITQAERGRIIALARSVPPGQPQRSPGGELAADDETGPPQWTLDTLTETARADGIEVHRSQLRRILLAERVRWRHTRSWTESKDPDFAKKGRRSSSSTPIRRNRPR